MRFPQTLYRPLSGHLPIGPDRGDAGWFEPSRSVLLAAVVMPGVWT
jgi:hypothetical protein